VPLPISITLDVVYRDFLAAQPDFNVQTNAFESELVFYNLSADGTPAFNFLRGPSSISSNNSFYDWFHDVNGVNQDIPATIELWVQGENPPVYSFTSGEFFPIDNLGLGNEGAAHNYFFTLALEGEFIYQGGEYLTFYSSDDLWLFINGL
jgi:hypothetical protein